MPRQPFLPTYKGERSGFMAGMIDHRPDFVAVIGRCITLWPYVEHNLALILGFFLKADNEATIAMFTALRQGGRKETRSWRPQRRPSTNERTACSKRSSQS
jgi:hypothetical protein